MGDNKKFTSNEIKSMQLKFAYLSTDKGKTIKQEDALILLRAWGQNPSNKEFTVALTEN